ncbi:MAG: hypothetical protein LBR13_01940 [Dysgonamonadaceae bacterium]|jgi:hypothetical protein|nr:hypothetical protein [Dysgonamonadaceae bacterium]
MNKKIAINILLLLAVLVSVILTCHAYPFRLDKVFLYGFIALFALSLLVQYTLLRRKNYGFYLFRVILVFFIIFQVYGIIESRKEVRSLPAPGTVYVIGAEYNGIGGFNERNISTKFTKLFGQDTVYSVNYTLDSVGRRIDENTFDTAAKARHAIFLGCSFTFGEGVDNNSTFPAIFERKNPQYKSYNYGISGTGPSHSVLFFDKKVNTINKETVKESDGFALYTFINDHLNRVYGSGAYITYAQLNSPNVFVDGDSLTVTCFPRMHFRKGKLYNYVYLLKKAGLRFEYPRTEDFYKRFAGIINCTARKYRDFNPNGKFFVAIYPYSSYRNKDLNWLKYLSPDITVIQAPLPNDVSGHRIENDGHPTGKANEYFIEQIEDQLISDTIS